MKKFYYYEIAMNEFMGEEVNQMQLAAARHELYCHCIRLGMTSEHIKEAMHPEDGMCIVEMYENKKQPATETLFARVYWLVFLALTLVGCMITVGWNGMIGFYGLCIMVFSLLMLLLGTSYIFDRLEKGN
jgi:hypothetical protein